MELEENPEGLETDNGNGFPRGFRGLVSRGNERLRSRLFNYKFATAVQYLEGESDVVVGLVETLSVMFENVGHGEDQGPIMNKLLWANVALLIGNHPGG